MKNKTNSLIAESTLNQVYSTMKKESSKSTILISINRQELSKKTKMSQRTIDRAISALKDKKMITKFGQNYVINN